ncbi:M1 family metallopeptidase [Humibacillus xanthopallidus]|uniref:Aminopeptidase N n=1 Tax=Humibacillus xanthopallidus TaxID=412689 RepID=A0A543HTL3_9MICO|nr:M1 family metallopeptidase [Humibacillus xanthopallidus]TQM61703.1 peptidase M1-like protein [Humibacillus xanthopallidus]
MSTRWKRALVATSALVLVSAGTAAAVGFSPGSPGAGDPYFPNAGNGGYDVSHYSLTLGYEPTSRQLTGTAVISATATQDLSRFDLDLRGFTISALQVNGTPAAFERVGTEELVITPSTGLRAGGAFSVTVTYSGIPQSVTDPDGSIEGWVPTADGAFVVGEPQGSPSWFPVNDTPRDKATFDFAVSVPEGLTVMANGVLVSNRSAGGRTTWVWRESDPMAPYLATATLGRFDLTVGQVGSIPSYVAIDPTLPAGNVFRKLPQIVQFYESIYGPYPFNAVGSVADNAPEVGYSLETQTKPVYDRMPDEPTVAHELSHMWLGDSVTLSQWPDIWLHEGFATWSEWMWSEHNGQKSAQSTFDTLYNTPASRTSFWTPPPGAPGDPAHLFDGTIYERGAMTVQALRQKVGDDTFFRIMRTWVQDNRYGNVSTPQFIALAETISGQDLGHFFDVWLYQREKPTSW